MKNRMSTHNHSMEFDVIMVIKLSSLGDVIHTLPAYSALRRSFPQKKLIWVVEKKAEPILELISGLDQIITVDIKNKPLISHFCSSIKEIKSNIKIHESLTLDFQGLIKSGLISYLSQAKKRIGFHKKNLKEPLASIFYTDQIKAVSENRHVIQKNMELISILGTKEKKWEFPILIPDNLTFLTLDKLKQKGIHIKQNAVVFNVGGAWETKRWFPERWIKLINLLDLSDFSPLILWGNREEKRIAEEISEKTGVETTPFLTIKEVLALIQQSILVVSGDSFPLQAASALSVPVVGLFGPTNPNRNGPFHKKDQLAFHEIPCSYCYKRSCLQMDCMNKIKSGEVAELCRKILTKNFSDNVY